jgi:hypothetical protein
VLLENWPLELRVCDPQSVLIWNPRAAIPPSPSWARQVYVEYVGANPYARLGGQLYFTLVHPPGVEVTYVRLNGRPLGYDSSGGTIDPVAVTTEAALSGWRFRIGLRKDGVLAQIEYASKPPVLGAAQPTEEGWRSLHPDRSLSVRDARNVPVRLILPADMNQARPALFEGDVFHRRLGQTARPLGMLAGTGAPLVLRDGPYNCTEDVLQLASGAVDFGLLRRRLEYDRDCGRYRLRLHHTIEPGPGHAVLCWSPSGGVHQVPPTDICAGDDGLTWDVPCPWPDDPEPVICAVAYEGRRLGFAWMGHWDRFFSPPSASGTPQDVLRTAALIRWHQLPVLLQDRHTHQPLFQNFARRLPAEVLSVWLFDSGLSGLDLFFEETPERRDADWSALQRIYSDWRPDEAQLASILTLFRQVRAGDPLDALVEWLLPEDPLLAGRILWLARSGITRQRLREWRGTLAGCPVKDAWLRQKENDACEKAAVTMRADARYNVDPNLVKSIAEEALGVLCGRRLLPFAANNLAVASGVGSFRHYLGLRVLNELERLIP